MSSFSIFRPIPHSSKRQRRDLIPNMFESIFDKYPFFRAVPCVLCMAIIFKLSSLTNEQLRSLLDEMIEKKVTPTCPHGRPLVVSISHRELDRKFKRIQQ